MTPRQRWLRTLHFQSVDRLPHEEFGYWDETLSTWHRQGLPLSADTPDKADRFFGFDRKAMAPADVGLYPHFQHEVISETATYQVIRDSIGVTCMIHKDGSSSIPHYIDFPLKGRNEWEEEFLPRLCPDTPGRVRLGPEELADTYASRDYPLGINIGSLFGWIRNWMGVERAAVTLYDDPRLIEEVMEQITQVVLQTIDRVAPHVRLDFAHGWEDMCFNHGPLISPDMVRRYMLPRYRRITDKLSRYGVDIVVVDCDGDINQLVPIWLEAGVNVMFPLERQSGTDPVALRREYGRDVLLMGGVDKIQLKYGRREIDAEVQRLTPLMEQGGYIPHVDHRVPPDVPYENYLYYLETKKRALGLA